MARCHDSAHIVCDDTLIPNYTRISNLGIGRNYGCNYKPIGVFGTSGTDVWESNGYSNRIMLIPNMTITTDPNIALKDAKPADTPTKYYRFTGGRNLYYNNSSGFGYGTSYYQAPEVEHMDSYDIVKNSELRIGEELASIINRYNLNGNHIQTSAGVDVVCRDNQTGSEYLCNYYSNIIREHSCSVLSICGWVMYVSPYEYSDRDIRRQIAYGNWYQDYIPSIIEYADHVTVFRTHLDTTYKSTTATGGYGSGGYLAHPLYSYFRSASILYSNTKTPNNISESDAENNKGNLVFTFNTSDTYKKKWHKLTELETWSISEVYNTYPYWLVGYGMQWSNWSGDWFGGSRSTLYYMVDKTGLHIGASGEMGNWFNDECESNRGAILNLGRKRITFEMVMDTDTRNPSWDGPWVSACFAGHGINIKARVKSIN